MALMMVTMYCNMTPCGLVELLNREILVQICHTVWRQNQHGGRRHGSPAIHANSMYSPSSYLTENIAGLHYKHQHRPVKAVWENNS